MPFRINPFTGTLSPVVEDLSESNINNSIYATGKDGKNNSWRIKVSDDSTELAIEHFDPLIDTDINLTAAHVTSIEGNSIYTVDDPYFASVLTDSRADNTTPAGITGTMIGRMLEWDGFLWRSFPDQWVSKATFSESIHSDRGVFRRMNVIATNPDDLTEHPPQPVSGTTIGSRNTQADGLGLEILSWKDQNGHFGHMMEFLHGPDDLINQARSIKLDATVIGFPYELVWVDGTTYAVGDVIVDAGVRFECNTAGIQSTSFTTNSALWDVVGYGTAAVPTFDVDTILTSSNGSVLVNQFGNVLVAG